SSKSIPRRIRLSCATSTTSRAFRDKSRPILETRLIRRRAMRAPEHSNRSGRAFWREPPDALLAELDTGLTGLTQEEAEKRLLVYGPNRFEAAHREAFLIKLGRRVLNPLVALLIAAAAVSGISGDFGSF